MIKNKIPIGSLVIHRNFYIVGIIQSYYYEAAEKIYYKYYPLFSTANLINELEESQFLSFWEIYPPPPSQ